MTGADAYPIDLSTAPALLASARGAPCRGPHRCVLCGARCGEGHPASAWLRGSFTARDTLASPSSPWCCPGCALAMTASAGQSPEGKPWMWSWVLTPDRADRLALCVMLGGDRVRAGRPGLLAACLDPPPPPCAVVLARAGRTHTLYRAAVHRGGAGLVATLDGRPVRYGRASLADRVSLCVRVAAAFGARVARDRLPVPPGRWRSALADDLDAWHSLLDDPLTALAACLFPDPDPPPKEAR